jgi:hypothetical protein
MRSMTTLECTLHVGGCSQAVLSPRGGLHVQKRSAWAAGRIAFDEAAVAGGCIGLLDTTQAFAFPYFFWR